MDLFPRVAASTVTFRDEPLEEAARRLHTLGFTRVDLTAIPDYCEHFDPLLMDVGAAHCYQVRDILAAQGLQAVSVTAYPANPLDRHIDHDDWIDAINAYVRLAEILESRLLIVPAGEPAPEPEVWRGEVEHAKPWVRDVARRALAVGLVPALAMRRNTILASSQHVREFLAIAGAVNLGVAVNTAHLALLGEDPVRALRVLGDALAVVSLVDTDGARADLPPGDGHLDFSAILATLQEIGYDGPLLLAVDDATLTPDARADALWRGWTHLDNMGLGMAA
jgi:sugar phosphate isomerase/epimerase